MIPEAFISHCIAGRMRVRIPSMRGDDPYFQRLEDSLHAISAVTELRANSVTGSVLILHTGLDPEALGAHAGEQGLFQLDTSPPEVELFLDKATVGARRLDARLKRFSEGTLDLPSTLTLALIVMAIAQMLRGQVLGPAVPMLWHAFGLMGMTRLSNPR